MILNIWDADWKIKQNMIQLKTRRTAQIKVKALKTIYRLLLLGSESWVSSKILKSGTQAMEMKYLRGVKCVSRVDKIINRKCE